MADGGEDDVGRIAGAAFEVAAAEVTISLQVSDDGLDGGAAAQLALDDAEDAALLAAPWVFARRGRGIPCRHRPARSHSR